MRKYEKQNENVNARTFTQKAIYYPRYVIASNALLSGGLEEVPEAFDPRGIFGDGEEGGEVAAVGRAQDEGHDQPRGHQDAG